MIDFKSCCNKYYKKTCNFVKNSNRSVPWEEKVPFNVSYFHFYTYKTGMLTISKNINSINKHYFLLTLPITNHVEIPIENYKDILPTNSNKMHYIKINILHSSF